MDVFVRNKPYTGRLRAAVLDWAGTCVDYGCLGPVAPFREAFQKKGLTITLAEARGPMGLAKKDHVKALLAMPEVARRWRETYGRDPAPNDVEEIYPDVEKMIVAAVAGHADPIPGALGAIEAFRTMGLKVGTCTGYTRPMVDILAPAAAGKGLVPDAVVCASDVPVGRPYPYMCYLNAVKLEVFPLEACVKIGDTVADIQEGLNAGMWTIGLTKTGNELGLPESEVEALAAVELNSRLTVIEERFRKAGAHYIVESLGDCPPIIEIINLRLVAGERPLSC
jgi:phosphonoacetaldehyde hydrolase